MKIICLRTLLLFILVQPTFAQRDAAARLDSLFTSAYDKGAFNGNVLVAEKGKVSFAKSYGFADFGEQRKLDRGSVFELASVSKQFTAMGIFLLQKQGKLRFEDKLAQYVPELGFYGDITIAQLIHHTGGLPDYMALLEQHWDLSKIATNEDVIRAMAEHKPAADFSPGTKFEYSNTGYMLLGTIIERVSKQSFGAYLKQHIFDPLKMNRTLVYRRRYQPAKVADYAFGYIVDDRGNKVLPDDSQTDNYVVPLDGIVGDGTVNSNVDDLLKWDRALNSDKLLNAKEREMLFAATTDNSGNEVPYAFGWMVRNDPKNGRIASHSGGWPGYISYIERQIDKDRTVIILQNLQAPGMSSRADKVRKILNGEGFSALSADAIAQYLGTYAAPNFPLEITVGNDGLQLTAVATGQSTIPLEYQGDHTFTFAPAGIKMVFRPEAKAFDFTQGSNAFTFTRK